MGFRLKIKGKGTTINLGIDMITSAHVQLSTPADSKAKSTNTAATMWVTGKLLSTKEGFSNNSDTLELFEWASVSAQSADAYRNVIVEVVSASQIFRKIHLPNAFVVDYAERYDDQAGVGEFALVLRQKADKIPDVKAENGGTDELEE